MAGHNEIGKQGEALAREYLRQKGYKILEQNYRTRRGEIDIIAERKGTLVFVEVRAKRRELFGAPEDTIRSRKQRKIALNAKAYVAKVRHTGPFRIDAICAIIGAQGTKRITHHENICG